jgi:hypothetical protein
MVEDHKTCAGCALVDSGGILCHDCDSLVWRIQGPGVRIQNNNVIVKYDAIIEFNAFLTPEF